MILLCLKFPDNIILLFGWVQSLWKVPELLLHYEEEYMFSLYIIQNSVGSEQFLLLEAINTPKCLLFPSLFTWLVIVIFIGTHMP